MIPRPRTVYMWKQLWLHTRPLLVLMLKTVAHSLTVCELVTLRKTVVFFIFVTAATIVNDHFLLVLLSLMLRVVL